jgi:hypothetical protein
MAAEKKRKKARNSSQANETISKRTLLNPEEWKDKPGRKVISEYHKDLPLESDVDKTSESVTNEEENPPNATQKNDSHHHNIKASQVFDISTIEMLAYAFSRSVFRRGVRIPLKVKDVMDMDIAVKDTDIILNTNDVSFELPPLQIWHVIFSYKGKPVFEYGRGVNNNLKIHYRHAFPFLLAMWLGTRKRRKAREEATEKACMELSQNPASKSGKNKKEHVGEQ